MGQVEQLVAPCGLYCGVCPLYQARTDRVLADKVASRLGLPVESCVCLGCRAQEGRVSVMGEQICESYDCCVRKKGLDFCHQCPDFACSKLFPCADRASEIPHNTKICNLLFIQKNGARKLTQVAAGLRQKYFRAKKVRPGGEPQF